MTDASKIVDKILPEKRKIEGLNLNKAQNKHYNQALTDIRQRLLDTYGKEWVAGKIDGETSDGYHTFNELYEHRVLLWINLCLLQHPKICYLVENHLDGWFLLGVQTPIGQLSYHCPNKYLDLCKLIPRVHPEFDGHTSQDVIDRLKNIASNHKPHLFNKKEWVGMPSVEVIAKSAYEYHRSKLVSMPKWEYLGDTELMKKDYMELAESILKGLRGK